ncbi:MAG: 4-(cytidine 5'-diphospho)-2-C-methyl-D-erythritol kinase [Chloroflexi bacterium]|nr:4-(cytidine 5'-diphospho)-2-C-methyl-D-erythritol kinase [Chloroflexota bacterium]
MSELTKVKTIAPAKINIALEVVNKRSDGFHNIDTVMSAISLSDTVTLTKTSPNSGVRLKTLGVGTNPIAQSDNLALRAATLLADRASIKRPDVNIELEKRIPLSAGLGGGSSDAAAVLRGLNVLWDINWPPDKIANLGSELGSDIPFFVYGGCARCTGRGEVVSPLPDGWSMNLVVLMPIVPYIKNKTSLMFQNLTTSDFSDGRHSWRVAQRLARGAPPATADIVNGFESTFSRLYPNVLSQFESYDFERTTQLHLSGAGPAVFTFLRKDAEFELLREHFQKLGAQCFMTQTLTAAESTEIEYVK